MTWSRLDDKFDIHPKVQRLSDRAFRVEVSAILYASRFETNGKLDDFAVGSIMTRIAPRTRTKVLTELIVAGLWELDEKPGTYLIHDFLEYNPSREEVERKRRTKAEAGRIGGINSGLQRRLKIVNE